MSGKKKWKYSDSYIAYGFTCMKTDGEEKPQCMICYQVLSNCSMKASKLKLHLQTHHSKYAHKDQIFFERHRNSLKSMKLDSDGSLHETNRRILEASYAVSLHIAKETAHYWRVADKAMCKKDG